MKRRTSHPWFTLAALLCLALAGCALPHPPSLIIHPPDGAIVFLPAPGTHIPVDVRAASPSTLFRGLSTSIQLVTTISDNGTQIYHAASGGISEIRTDWSPTSIGDHLLVFNFAVTYASAPSGVQNFTYHSRVCVLNNYFYSYPGLQVGTSNDCPSFLWAAFGRLTPGDRPLAVVAPRPLQLHPFPSPTPSVRLTPHVIQPFPTDTPAPTDTATPTAVNCPKGTANTPSLGPRCYYVTRTPKPQGTVAAACFTYHSPSVCTSNGCSWDKGSSTCK